MAKLPASYQIHSGMAKAGREASTVSGAAGLTGPTGSGCSGDMEPDAGGSGRVVVISCEGDAGIESISRIAGVAGTTSVAAEVFERAASVARSRRPVISKP